MILTPIAADHLEPTLARFEDSLPPDAARAVFQRVAIPAGATRADPDSALKNYAEAIDLIAKFGIEMIRRTARSDVTWDGRALRIETEAYVLLHELAHYQLAAPARRRRVDFGLGPGPETGDLERALRDQTVFGLAREREEARASLLGILWEAELGHPALASLLEQNWLEGVGRPGAAAHFTATLDALSDEGFIDAAGRPKMHLRRDPDR